MISGFFHTIQTDLIDLTHAVTNSNKVKSRIQDDLITLAAMRVFSAFNMCIGALTAVSALAFFATAPVGAVLTMAVGICLYALGHDLFVMYRKQSEILKNPINGVETGLKGIFIDTTNFLKGNLENVGEGFFVSFTEGTFYQPLWIKFLTPDLGK